MFGLSDIVALAKSGYSVSDVKELIALSKEPPQPETPPAEVVDIKSDEVQPPDNSTTVQEPNKQPEEVKTDLNIAANNKIKELEENIKVLKTQLTAAQSININKDQSSSYVKPMTDAERLVELWRKG